MNKLRKYMFCAKSRPMECLPPTKDALMQHIKRSAYVAGFIWGKSLEVSYTAPSPDEWGWRIDAEGQWRPKWTMLPEMSEKSRELLVRCGCKMGCSSKRCSCLRAGLDCCGLCACEGGSGDI